MANISAQLLLIIKWESSDRLLSVKRKSLTPLRFSASISFEFGRLSSPTASGWTATAGSDVVQSGRPIFDDFFQHLWPYIGNNTANVVFQTVKRLWLIRIDQ
ncbi:hypothetical protein TNCV_3269921 [Trichonephila clavipes]|uniref:Uncharacterized protein n=1 Tax=Trichonephila clavipes TaxID=2585209 RepID=A0A8X6VGF7_TRICX|nr:hypothetical protein TNCV_3269921 [Trichonephila clavipes]